MGLSLALAPTAAFAQSSGAAAAEPRFDDKGRPIPSAPETPKGGAQEGAPPAGVTLPEPQNHPQPAYTDEAKAKGVEGSVVLRLTIDEAGKVARALVESGLGHGLDEAALAAAKELVFTPARRNDKPFRATVRYRFDFRLEERIVEVARALGELRGTVRIQGEEEPLVGAKLVLTEATASADVYAPPITRELTAGADGSFAFGALPAGDYRIAVTAPGFDELVVRESIKEETESVATYRLVRTAVPGTIEILVTDEAPPREVTRRTIEKREIERIPGTNGDALRSLQSLPGVARPPGILGALLVRGSGPTDTQTFVDGTFVPLIYHFGGLTSVVPTELLSRIDFYPGNYSARYGRAMGGIVDAGLRSPRTDGLHGLAQADLIDARAMLEGPIPDTGGDFSFAVAGRRSYVDAWLGPVLEEAGAGVTQAPVYYDYQLVLDGKPRRGHKLRASFYGSDDRLDLLVHDPAPNEPALSGDVSLATSFQRAAISYDVDLKGGDRVESMVSFGRESIQFSLSQFFFRVQALTLFARAEYQTQLSPTATMNAGLDLFSGGFDVALRLPAPPQPGQPPNQPFSTRSLESYSERTYAMLPGAYVELELRPNERTRIVPGVRMDYYQLNHALDVSPRLNARYVLKDTFPRTTLKGGAGVFFQPPQIQELRPPFGSPSVASNRAIHYGLGAEQEVTQQVDVTLEGFAKQLDHLVVSHASPDGRVAFANDGAGYAVGGELLVKYKPDERFFGWLSYTLSRSARRDGPDAPLHLVPWDQTHILTVLGSYRLGDGWELGARFRLVSGNLVTPNVCDATSDTCDPNRIGGLFHGASGAYTPIPSAEIFSERLPYFHQLDLRVDKSWQLEDFKVSAYLDVQNAYNQGNVEAILYNFNYTRRQFVTGLPIIPSLGVRGDF